MSMLLTLSPPDDFAPSKQRCAESIKSRVGKLFGGIESVANPALMERMDPLLEA